MRKLFAILLAILAATSASGQTVHTFKYARLYDTDTLRVVIDPGDAGSAGPAVQMAVIVQRYPGLWDRDASHALPEWWGFESSDKTDASVRAAGEMMPISYHAVGPSASRPDSQIFKFYVGDAGEFADTFAIGYRMGAGGVKGPWFYATATRETGPVADPSTSASFVICDCDAAYATGEDCPVTVWISGVSGLTCIRMELWDSAEEAWVAASNPVGGEWSAWIDGLNYGVFNLPCPMVTNGDTRFYWRTTDGAEHGPVPGPTMTISDCSQVALDQGQYAIPVVTSFSIGDMSSGGSGSVAAEIDAGFNKVADYRLIFWQYGEDEPDTSGFSFSGTPADTVSESFDTTVPWPVADSDSSVTITWTTGYPAPTLGYRIEVSVDDGAFQLLANYDVLGPEATSYEHNGASPVPVVRAKLVYRITALSGSYESSPVVADPLFNDAVQVFYRLQLYDLTNYAVSWIESGIGIAYPAELGGGRKFYPAW